MPLSHVQAQDRAIHSLMNAVRADRVPNAWLFTGPEGVGKAMVARGLAGVLVGPEPPDAVRRTSLGWRKADEGIHPDLVWVEPQGAGRRVKIDQVREVVRAFRYAPFEATRRVVVFPEADRLGEEAANALLKGLEEPPPHTVLILVSSKSHALLDTIRSRCQEVRFAPLPRKLCAEILEGLGVSPAEAPIAAALAEGSVGRGAALAEAGILEDRRASLQAVAELSPQRPAALFELAASWSAGPDASSSRAALGARLDLLASWYRDVAVAASGKGELIHADLAVQIRRAASMGARSALSCVDAISHARGALELNAGARLTCEKLLVILARQAA
jgi:DNA polymerase-3 subunit delta'